MKTLKTILISLIVIVALLFSGVFIFIKTFDVNKYLPQITRQAGSAINRKVNVDHADLNLGLNGLSLELRNITISDDPQFGTNDFLDLEGAYLGLDVMTLIMNRQVNITKLVLNSPKLSVVRVQNGSLNVQTMVPASSGHESSPAQPSAASEPPASGAMVLPAVSIQSVSITNARLSFKDENAQMPINAVVSNGQINITNFSLSDPFDFTVSLNAWGSSQNNVMVSGRATLDLSHAAAHIKGLRITSDLNLWDWNEFRTVTPMLQKLPVWPQEVKGHALLDIPELSASAKGLEGLVLHMSLTDGYVKLKELLSAFDNISLQADSDLKDLSVKQLQAHAGTGVIEAQLDVHGITSSPTYNFQLQSKSVKVESLIDQSKAPAVLKGDVDGQFTGSGAGFDPQLMLQNLKGQGQFSLKNAEIDKLNILKTILDKLNFIPGLGAIVQNALETSISSTLKSELDTDTTVLDKAEGTVKVENKTVSIEDSQLESKLFSIGAKGTMDFDLNTRIDVNTYLAADLSAALTKSAKPLQGLLDEQNRLYIPGKVSGTAPSLSYQPQIDYISKKVAISEGSQQLQKVLGKNPGVANILNAVLGGGQTASTDSTGSAADQSSTTQGQNQDDSSKKIINGFLNTILH
jgi:hypothetical protein